MKNSNYSAPKYNGINFSLSGVYSGYDDTISFADNSTIDFNGNGVLSGQIQTKTVGSPGKIRVLYHSIETSKYADGEIVREVDTLSDGTFSVSGLNEVYFYDVIARNDGWNDRVYTKVKPWSADAFVITLSGSFTTNDDFNGVAGFMTIHGGMPPFTASVVDPLPYGLTPLVVDGRKLIIDGTSDDVGLWESVVRVTDINGLFVDTPVSVEIRQAVDPVDPHFGNVSLLLHMDGIQGSTTFADSSPLTKVVTAHGSAAVSTAHSQFGGASLLLDGVESYLSTPGHADYVFGTGDFSIEAWIRTTRTDEKVIVDHYSSFHPSWQLAVKYGKLSFYSRTEFGSGGYVLSGSIPVNDNQFHFVSVTRQDGVLRFFVDGVPDGEAPLTTNYNAAITLSIGAQVASRNSTYDFHGNIDDVRITKGVARYTASFTPPDEPFPNQ